jgi:hypothetical protein
MVDFLGFFPFPFSVKGLFLATTFANLTLFGGLEMARLELDRIYPLKFSQWTP